MGVNDKVRGKTDIGATGGLIEVGILLYPGVQMSAVLGLTDLFGVANRLSAEHGGTNPRELRISHWQLRNNENLELGRVFDTHHQQPQRLVSLILPPVSILTPREEQVPDFKDGLKSSILRAVSSAQFAAGPFFLPRQGC